MKVEEQSSVTAAKKPAKSAAKSVAKPSSKTPAATVATPATKAKGASKKANKVAVDPFDAEVVGKMLPYLRALRGYTRLKVEGLEHLPRDGPAILAANHTGWLGLDYALAALVVHDEAGRTPRGMAHSAWFLNPVTKKFAGQVGLSKVSKESMVQQLAAGHLVMVFPEGEHGAFRPANNYQVMEFARGFVRVALATGVPVIPVCILGGEESNPVDRTIKGYEELLKLEIPVPRNFLPKPVKWRIAFLPPVGFGGARPEDADDSDKVHALAKEIQESVQTNLRRMIKERGHPYL